MLLAAAAVRVAYLAVFVRTPLHEIYRNDHFLYREWALRIAQGEWLGRAPFEQGPLYAYLLGALYRVLGARDAAVLAVQLAAGLVTVGLVAWCARRVHGTTAALASGALAALYGPLLFHEALIMKTFLEPLLVAGALAAGLLALETGRVRCHAAAGGAIGLACLVREVHALLLVPLVLAAWFSGPRGSLRGSRRLLAPGAVLLGCALALAPSFARNWFVSREIVAVSSTAGQNLYIAFGPSATGYYVLPPFATSLAFKEHEDFRVEAYLRTGRPLTRGESSRYWLGETLAWVRSAPYQALRLVGVKAAILFNDLELPDSEDFTVTRAFVPLLRFLPTFGWIAGPGLLGFILLCRRRGAPRLAAGFAAALIAEVLLTFNLGRYRAALAAVWLLCAGVAIAWLLGAGGTRAGARVRLRAAGAALAALLTALAFRDPPGREPSQLPAMHDRFRAQAEQSAVARRTIPDLQAALASRPGDPALLTPLAAALEGVGRISEAVRVYEELVVLGPDRVAPRSRLIEISDRMGDPDRSLRHARALVSLRPLEAGGWITLGRLLVRQAERAPAASAREGLRGEAAVALARALALDARAAAAHYWLARVRLLAGDAAGALREADAARRLAAERSLPDEYQAAGHLARLLRARA